MSDDDDDDNDGADPAQGNQAAAKAVFSLSQALLAPIDALLKAQVHSARSFLNFLLQLSFPEQGPKPLPQSGTSPAPGGAPTTPAPSGVKPPFTIDFPYRATDGVERVISVPTLALVPVAPLGVTGAEFQFDFYVSQVGPHRQTRRHAESNTTAKPAPATSEEDRRPWFLVDDPVSLRGTFAPQADERADQLGQYSRFHIEVKVAQLPVPAALEKMLSTLGQLTTTQSTGPTPAPDPTKPTS